MSPNHTQYTGYMKQRRLTTCISILFTICVVLNTTACGNTQPHTAEQNYAGSSQNTPAAPTEQSTDQNTNQQTPQSNTATDPTSDTNWTESFTQRSELDGELDEVWLKCAPQNNPAPNDFSWKRAADHSKVWLHSSQTTLGTAQRDCMDDELDLDDTVRSSSTSVSSAMPDWAQVSSDEYVRYERINSDSTDIVWAYDRIARRQLTTTTANGYTVTLPYAWLGKARFVPETGTDDLAVVSNEHPQYELCRFTVTDADSGTNGDDATTDGMNSAGDIGNSLIVATQVNGKTVQMWATRWAFVAATDPGKISTDDAEDITELQTGDSVDFDTLMRQVGDGDYSGLFAIDEYLKTHVTIS